VSHIVPRFRRGALLLALGAAACAPRGRAPAGAPGALQPAAASEECRLTGSDAPADTLTVALPGPVDAAHAPRPVTEAERLVFRQLYEPLIHVDCRGRVTPGLAGSWMAADGGRRWSFALRDGARFWDGTPVTSEDVRASWAASERGLDERVTIVSDRVLTVYFAQPYATVPPRFADQALAVYKKVPGLGWPIGTGAYWLDESGGDGNLRALPAFGDPLPVLAFRVASGDDPRDLLDAGVDLLVTGDRTVVQYAATRPDFTIAPLPWDRTYVLLTRESVSVSEQARRGLADAVRADARPAEATDCHVAPAAAPANDGGGAAGPRRIAYAQGDRTARELAGRLVALGIGGASATGLSADDLAARLHAGSATAFVVALSRADADPCLDYPSLPLRAPWLGSVAPLVDTRRDALVRRAAGVAGLVADGDGVVRVTPAPPR
jgi:hypothetical protein